MGAEPQRRSGRSGRPRVVQPRMAARRRLGVFAAPVEPDPDAERLRADQRAGDERRRA